MTLIRTLPSTRPVLSSALAAGAASTVLLLAGLYLDTPWKKQGNKEWAFTTDHQSVAALLASLGFVAAGVAVVLALNARSRLGRTTATAWIVLVIAALTTVAAIELALVG